VGAKEEALVYVLQLQAHQILEVVEEGVVIPEINVLELGVLELSFFNFKLQPAVQSQYPTVLSQHQAHKVQFHMQEQ